MALKVSTREDLRAGNVWFHCPFLEVEPLALEEEALPVPVALGTPETSGAGLASTTLTVFVVLRE